MGGQENDPAGTIVGPSIALLQERFKKLKKLKEKRQEEKQLSSLFSSSSSRSSVAKRIIVPTNYNNNMNYNFLTTSNDHNHDHQKFVNPSSRSAGPTVHNYQDPLSLGLNLTNKHADYRALKKTSSMATRPSFAALWSVHHDKRGVKRPQKHDVLPDVDTTLHL